jgi:hypothetical protein
MIGDTVRVDRVEADGFLTRERHYAFMRNPKSNEDNLEDSVLVACYPIERTIIFRIDRP